MTDPSNSSVDNLKPLVLHYYSIRGVAQPIRILLHCLQIDYVDNYLQKNEENEMESGFRLGLPMLQDGDFKVCEQISIINYLAMKTNKQCLLGLTPQDSAKINELLFKYSVQKKKIMSTIMEGLKYLEDATMNKKQLNEKTLKKIVEQCKFVEVCLKRIQRTKKFTFDYLTIIDFLFYEICFYVEGFYKEIVTKQSEYYWFIKFKNQFEKQDFFVKNRKRIEQNQLFFEFTTPSLNMMVSKLWKGSESENIFVKALPPKA